MITEFKTYEKWPVSSNITRFGEGGKRLKSQINQYDNNNPLISIITVTYNGEKYMRKHSKVFLNKLIKIMNIL